MQFVFHVFQTGFEHSPNEMSSSVFLIVSLQGKKHIPTDTVINFFFLIIWEKLVITRKDTVL